MLIQKFLACIKNLNSLQIIYFLILLLHFKAEEDDGEKEQEIPKHITESRTPDRESCISETFEPAPIEEAPQNNELEMFKHRQFIEKIQRLSSLKRKSDEFLQKTYFSEVNEKRAKTKEKSPFNKQSPMLQSNNYDVKNLYEDKADISTSYNTQNCTSMDKEINDKNKDHSPSDNALELKTECDDMDIIVTDPAVCATPKSYDNARDGKKDLPLPLDYQSPQDSKYFFFMKCLHYCRLFK